MTVIARVDPDDSRSRMALEAERRLFAHYGLDYKVHSVEMDEPGLRLRVLEVGEGPPLLMVPGGAGDAQFFAPLMAHLRGWRMIAINRPGGGMSDAVDHRRVDVRQLAVRTIETVADAFALEGVPIVCNSMGGLWSFWYALANPDRVSSMVQMGCPALALNTSAPFLLRLMGVPGIRRLILPNMRPADVDGALDGLRFQGSRQEDIQRMSRVLAEAFYAFGNLPTFLETWKTLIAAVSTITGANPRYQLRAEELRRVQVPVLLIWGDRDPFGGLEVAREVARVLPNATLHEMPTGHLPFLDKPEETGALVRAFLEGQAAGRQVIPREVSRQGQAS